MKIILMLFPLMCLAEIKINILTETGIPMSQEVATMEDAINYVDKAKNKWGKDKGWYKKECQNPLQTRVVKNALGEDITEYQCEATYTVTYEDITNQKQQKQIERMAMKNIKCGQKVKAFIGYLNISKGLTKAQIKQFIDTYKKVIGIIDGGALDTAIEEITALTPDGTLVTESDKTAIIEKINSCKVTWQ